VVVLNVYIETRSACAWTECDVSINQSINQSSMKPLVA